MLDREAPSVTYGSFDRTFWAWKFTDFPAPRLQEGVYLLSWLYAKGDKPYRGNAEVLALVTAGFRYWQSLQHADGSYDEAYPFEHSLAATAFSAFYLAEAFEHVKDALERQLVHDLKRTFVRAGDWLCRNHERHGLLSNHLAAAAAALVGIERITNTERFRSRAQFFLNRIVASQSPEGWYEEYGGADIGYQTHGMFYLARIWQKTGDVQLLNSIKRSLEFLQYFIHPDATLGGEYASRNTTFYFPAAFEMLAVESPIAAAIASFMRRAVQEQTAAGVDSMDTWNFFPLINNYLYAADNAARLEDCQPLPFREVGDWRFLDAGIWVKSTRYYYLIVGISKGGVVQLYEKSTGTVSLVDDGYWARAPSGRTVSNQSYDRNYRAVWNENEVRVRAPFVELNQRTMTPWLFIAFRLFCLLFGRFRRISYAVKDLLVHVLVKRRKPVELLLERRIIAEEDRVQIQDRLEGELYHQLTDITRGGRFSTIHMGSSRYFESKELVCFELPRLHDRRAVCEWRAT